MSRFIWPRYVPVAERRAKAEKKMKQLRKKGMEICPVKIEGHKIVHNFWGKSWCEHLESFSDFANRLPRGRTYVRNGSVCHLDINSGRIKAMVSGSSLYNVNIKIEPLGVEKWKELKNKCSGQIGSLLELVQGKLSEEVMRIVTDRHKGLFPQPREISLQCDCPDCAIMCKHVASVLYGVGHRLDQEPELLFALRGVDARELISAEVNFEDLVAEDTADSFSSDELGELFGVQWDEDIQLSDASPESKEPKPVKQKQEKKAQKDTAKPKAGSRVKTKREQGKKPLDPPTGKKIARLRKQSGLSTSAFARRIGVSAGSVYRWERTAGQLGLQERCLYALRDLYQALNTKSK